MKTMAGWIFGVFGLGLALGNYLPVPGAVASHDVVAESELTTRLSEAFEGKAEKILFLKADEGLEYRDVMRVMELCRDAGADEIGLITEKKTG